jgi:uracil-DNA glycosylase
MAKPKLYSGEPHPNNYLNIKRECDACSLGKGLAVGSGGPDDITEIKLIVISDHPGHYETQAGYPFLDNQVARQPKLNRKTGYRSILKFRNAGSIIRQYLYEMFSLDTYRQVWMTNALKCDPGPTTPHEKHLKVCAQTWLIREISILDRAVPTCPILILGRHAFKSIKLVAKTDLPKNLDSGRRSNHYRLGNHPLVFTYNPAVFARSVPRYEDVCTTTGDGRVIIRSVKEYEDMPYTPVWHFKKDLEYLREFLNGENSTLSKD